MIEEVRLMRPDPGLAMVLSVIGGGEPTPKQIEPGILLATHWNTGDLLGRDWDKWWFDENADEKMPPSLGVCDSIEQFKERFLEVLKNDRSFVYAISFVRIVRAEQSPDGGWRWHKWGEYIGTKSPQHEYLYDEKDIDEVFTFTVHRKPVR